MKNKNKLAKVSILFERKTYPSKKALSNAYDINYSTFHGRLERGYTFREALGLDQRKKEKKTRKGNEITVDSKTYRSIKEAVEAYGCSYEAVCRNLRKGDTIEQAFGLVEKKKKVRVTPGKRVLVEEKIYPSIKAAANDYGKSPTLVRQRIKNNWTIEESLGITPRSNYKAKIPIEVEGKIFESVRAASQEYGLNYNAVHFRLHNGYSVEEAFEICDRTRKGTEIVVEGKFYPSRISVCKAYKKDYKLVQSRTQNGWTIEEALELIPRKFYENGEMGYIYLIKNIINGKKYIGVTRDTPDNRFKAHVRNAYQQNVILPLDGLHHAIKTYGVDKFELSVLDSAKSLDELKKLEESYIKEQSSEVPVGYNLTSRSCGLDSTGVKTVVNGVEYPSLRDAARAYGISHETVRGRLNDGWSCEEAFGLVEKENLNAITLEGKEYLSRLQAAQAYEIDVKLVEARFKIGWSKEEAFGIKNKPNASHCPVMVNNICYPSLAVAARKHKIPLSLVRSRKRKGFTIEEALEIKEREVEHPLHIKIKVEDKIFSNVKEAADFYHINPATVRNRLVNGYTANEALGIVPRKRRTAKKDDKKIVVNGRTFANIGEAAEFYNIKKNTIRGRLNAKWSINEAFGLVPRMKKDSVEIQGKTYSSISEAAEKHSIQSYVVKARIKLGWNLEEALEIKERPEKGGVSISITIEGKSFASKKDAADEYGIHYGVFKWRIQNGWTSEQAVGIESRPVKNGQNEITVQGKVFASLREASAAYGQKYTTVGRRIRDLGWSLDKALGIEN